MIVHEPTTALAALGILAQDPETLIVAGGTQVMRSPGGPFRGRTLLSLRKVDTLSKVSRSQRYLDIGATVSLSRILSIGPRVVPACLFAALKATASPAVRLLATLGGNVCAPDGEHTCLVALAAFDAQLELRGAGTARMVPASHFWAGGTDRAIRPGELLMRVRLPLEEGAIGTFAERTVAWQDRPTRTALAAVASVHRDVLEEMRLCLSTAAHGTLRFSDFESACPGVRLPLRERTLEELLSVLKRSVVQRLGVPMPEAEPLLAAVLDHAESLLRRVSRGEIDRGTPSP